VLILFWAVIKVLFHIEDSFNNIWGIKKSRTWGRKLSDYLSLMLICPVLLIVSSSITVLVATQVEFILRKIAFLSTLNSIIFSVLSLLPYSVLWILFTFIYKFMPNIKVKFTSALLAGVVAGTIYELVQWGYITFQVGMSQYNAIYGGFAALPLFLVWLQLSWLIVLLGAELSFAYQNVDQYELEPDCQRVSVSFKRLLSLRITHLLVKNFSGDNAPITATSIAHLLKIPVRLVRQLLFELVESGIVSEVKTDEQNESAYQPAHDGEKLTIKYVIDALEHRGLEALPITQTRELDDLSKSLAEFDTIIEKSPANKSLKDI
jgi:membrane protein